MIDIIDVKITDVFADQPSRALVQSPGSYVRAEIDFYVHWEAMNIALTFGSNFINWQGGDFFAAGFIVGDKFRLQNNVNPDVEYTILSMTAERIVCSPNLVSLIPDSVVNVIGVTPITALKYKFGIIENGEPANFLSKLDGTSEQGYYAKGILATVLTTTNLLPITGQKHWIAGGLNTEAVTVAGAGIGNTGLSHGREQRFKIVQEFYVNPLYLESQLTNGFYDKTKNEYLFDTASLKFVPYIECSESTDSFAYRHNTTQGNLKSFLSKGDVGDYGENKNGGAPVFTAALTLTDTTSGNPVTDLVASGNMTFSIDVDTIPGTGSAFIVGGDNRAVVSIWQVVDESVYLNPVNNMFTNLNFARAVYRQNGANTNGTYITTTTISAISTSKLRVTGSITHQSWMVEGARYMLAIETESTNNARVAGTDKMKLLLKDSTVINYIDLTGIISNAVLINDHSTNDRLNGFTSYRGWIEDDILISDSVVVKKTNAQGTITLQKLNVSIDVISASGSFSLFTSEDLFIGDDGQIDFNLVSGDERQHFYLLNNPATTTGTHNGYLLQYPLRLRFEEWLNQVNAPAGFVGNKNWANYFAVNGWTLYITVNESLTIGTNAATCNHRTVLGVLDYDEFDTCEVFGEIQTSGATTGKNYDGKLAKNEDTIVSAVFDGDGLDCYSFEDTMFWGFLHWWLTGESTVYNLNEISSIKDVKPGVLWQGLAGDKAKITKISSPKTVLVEAVLQTTQMDQTLTNIALSARLGKTVFTALAEQFYEIAYTAGDFYRKSLVITAPRADSTFAEIFFNVTQAFILQTIAAGPTISELKFNRNGGTYLTVLDLPLQFFAGDVMGVKIVFVPGNLTGNVYIN